MKKIYFIPILLCFFLSGCSQTNLNSEQFESTEDFVKESSNSDDTNKDILLFSSFVANNWTAVNFTYGGVTDGTNPIQFTDQIQIKQFYQAFENTELVPTDEAYQGYFCKLDIVASENKFTITVISDSCISIDEKKYKVDTDFTEKILKLLSDFGYTRDNYPQSIEFSSIVPNDWTAISFTYGGITDSQNPIQVTEKSHVDEVYQIFQNTSLTKAEGPYQGYWGELTITTLNENLSIVILTPDKITIGDTIYSVSSDFTQEIPLLLKSLQYM